MKIEKRERLFVFNTGEWLCENVCCLHIGRDVLNVDFVVGVNTANKVMPCVDMFGARMPNVVFDVL